MTMIVSAVVQTDSSCSAVQTGCGVAVQQSIQQLLLECELEVGCSRCIREDFATETHSNSSWHV